MTFYGQLDSVGDDIRSGRRWRRPRLRVLQLLRSSGDDRLGLELLRFAWFAGARSPLAPVRQPVRQQDAVGRATTGEGLVPPPNDNWDAAA